MVPYKRDERAAVETIASRLRDLGLTVWFDASMSAGETFNAEIDREARAAKAMVVCWSPAARKSERVNAEAMIGFEQKKLAACYVAGPDGFSAPTPFNATHAEDLRAWLAAPAESHAGWKSVLRRVGKLCGRADIETWGALDANAPSVEFRACIAAHKESPLLVAVGTLLRARDYEDAERRRLEQEAGERQAREAAQEAEVARMEREAGKGQDGGSAEGLFWGGTTLVVTFVIGAIFFASSAPPRTQRQEEPFHVASLEGPIAHREALPEQLAEFASTSSNALEFDDCGGAGWCPRMVAIPAGNFMMGSPNSEPGRHDDEGPQRLVNIGQFAVGKFEVTFDQWAECVRGGGCIGNPSPRDERWGRGTRPVISVRWSDARDYVQWLSQATGQTYRLLTEAEWEYATRAGTSRAYPTESVITTGQANFNTANGRTQQVGAYAANAFGLHDMLGNVSEWVQDCYAPSYFDLPDDGSARAADDCAQRLHRGGGWATDPSWLRSAARSKSGPDTQSQYIGFRVARTLEGVE